MYKLICDRRDHFRKGIPGTLDLPSPAIMEGDIPLDNACKKVLAYAVQEADKFNSNPIDTQHLVLAIFCERRSLGTKLLAQAGIKLASARRLAAGSDPAGSSKPGALWWLLYFFVLAGVIVAVYFVVR